MPLRFPAPLSPGDTIAITSPSSGVAERLHPRLDVAVRTLRERGFDVVVGDCMDGAGHVSAPAAERARELTEYLTDPGVRAIVPPWGGETAIDLLPLLDWGAIGIAEPTWCVGYSDMSTILTPLTLLTGVATIHGTNLMDTPYAAPAGLLHWLDIVTAPPGGELTQSSPGRYRTEGFDDWTADPEVSELTLDGTGSWVRLDGSGDGEGPVDVRGRLIGGCIETLAHVAGTPYGDVTGWAEQHAPEGLIIYVEAADEEAFGICRALHGMRLAGFFDAAEAVIVGRTGARDQPTLTQREAVLDALGELGVPIVADVECGHVAPSLPLVNGALAHLQHGPDVHTITQTLA